MRFQLDIDYPLEKMHQSRERLQARAEFKYVDRVPVGFCIVPRFLAPIFGIPYGEIFKDAETQYYWQLQFHKFRLENVPEDLACQGPTVGVYPYFDNVLDSDAFGAETIWPEDETLHTRPTIRTVDAMERFEVPEPTAGLWATALDWWQQMKEFARETRVSFAGHEGRVEVGVLNTSGLDPHMIAVDLVGVEFYAWMLECPEACHRFLDKITNGLIRARRHFMEVDPRPRGGFGLAADTATVLSPDTFREFVVPYDNRLYGTFGRGLRDGRGLHMCGPSAHLHEALVNDLKLSSFNIFGYQVPPAVAAANLGGRMLLWGNINPMLMLNGTREEVRSACRHALEALAPCGGFMLGDGANVCPGTPLENLSVFVGTAAEYGVGDGRLPQ